MHAAVNLASLLLPHTAADTHASAASNASAPASPFASLLALLTPAPAKSDLRGALHAGVAPAATQASDKDAALLPKPKGRVRAAGDASDGVVALPMPAATTQIVANPIKLAVGTEKLRPTIAPTADVEQGAAAFPAITASLPAAAKTDAPAVHAAPATRGAKGPDAGLHAAMQGAALAESKAPSHVAHGANPVERSDVRPATQTRLTVAAQTTPHTATQNEAIAPTAQRALPVQPQTTVHPSERAANPHENVSPIVSANASATARVSIPRNSTQARSVTSPATHVAIAEHGAPAKSAAPATAERPAENVRTAIGTSPASVAPALPKHITARMSVISEQPVPATPPASRATSIASSGPAPQARASAQAVLARDVISVRIANVDQDTTVVHSVPLTALKHVASVPGTASPKVAFQPATASAVPAIVSNSTNEPAERPATASTRTSDSPTGRRDANADHSVPLTVLKHVFARPDVVSPAAKQSPTAAVVQTPHSEPATVKVELAVRAAPAANAATVSATILSLTPPVAAPPTVETEQRAPSKATPKTREIVVADVAQSVGAPAPKPAPVNHQAFSKEPVVAAFDAPVEHAARWQEHVTKPSPAAIADQPGPATKAHATPVAAEATPATQAEPVTQTTAVTQPPAAQPTSTEQPLRLPEHKSSHDAGVAPEIQALAVRIAAKSALGNKRFDIRLDPPEMGRIDVRLDVDNNGRASAQLSADKPQTLDLLARDHRDLERALKDAGLDLGSMSFSLKGEERQTAPRAIAQPEAESRSHISAVTPAAPIARWSTVTDARVDIRV